MLSEMISLSHQKVHRGSSLTLEIKLVQSSLNCWAWNVRHRTMHNKCTRVISSFFHDFIQISTYHRTFNDCTPQRENSQKQNEVCSKPQVYHRRYSSFVLYPDILYMHWSYEHSKLN